MKKYVPLIALALTLSLSTSAFAMEVPTDILPSLTCGSSTTGATPWIAS